MQPDIGDHTGTAPHPEFCLMCPAEDDSSAEAIEKKKLIEVCSKVNEGRHPAVLLLWPNNGKDDGVKVLDKGEGVSRRDDQAAPSRPGTRRRRSASR